MPVEIMGREVGSIGYGLMSLTKPNTTLSEEAAFATLRAALANDCNLWNAGEFYGTPSHNSLTLLRNYFTAYPDDASKVVLNVKGGMRLPDMTPDGSPEYVRASVENCLRLLDGKCKIDMFECARVDPKVPLAETLSVLKGFVDEGKIGGVALSEVGAKTIRAAAAFTKIVAVEVEVSAWQTGVLRNGVAEACAELGIPIIAYSPLGRGILAGSIKSAADVPANDPRRMHPRYQPENLDTNLQLVKELVSIAEQKGCTPAQLAINWVRSLSGRVAGTDVIPIPSATSVERMKENSMVVGFTEEELGRIAEVLERCEVKGDRYPARWMGMVDG